MYALGQSVTRGNFKLLNPSNSYGINVYFVAYALLCQKYFSKNTKAYTVIGAQRSTTAAHESQFKNAFTVHKNVFRKIKNQLARQYKWFYSVK